ncbi:MAG: SDR family NAD(P)-dependent oxidoreductase [Tepidisphaera sp.]|nr:SDR family NAD(P)-dependent oxidoreductase [Tepidisphaera sp.]
MSIDIHPKVWLITGASSGFGRAMANYVASRGDHVVVTSRKLEQLTELAAVHKGLIHPIATDITIPGDCDEAVKLAQGLGGLDVLVNNAGYGLLGAFEECSELEVRRCIETNLFGPLNMARAALPVMRGQKRGVIVNISAAAAISNYAGFAAYGAAKAGMELAFEAIAAEVRPLGIRVCLVQPGPFRTGFISRSLHRGERHMPEYDATSGRFAKFLASIDGKQAGDPEKAAKIICDTAASEDVPLRLVLGKYAVDKARRMHQAALADLERQIEVASSADGK